MKVMKKHVSMPGLLARVRSQFEKVKDTPKRQGSVKLSDCLMSGLAIFGLKFPSLLQFDEMRRDKLREHNLKALYGITDVPCDTYLRERLDVVEPVTVRLPFNRVFALLQRSKVVERYRYYEGYHLVSLDGTGCFSSHDIHCESCCIKEHQDGSRTYYHQMLGAVMVHPDEKAVIPFAPEPILKQDGATKNDSERNASKRLLEVMRREHPHLKIIIVEDGLASNAPHIQLLNKLDMRYILVAKPADHKFLFNIVNQSETQKLEEIGEDGTIHTYRWLNNVSLNKAHPDVTVNFLDYWEISPNGRRKGKPKIQHWTWVTDIPLTPSTVSLVMRGGRTRWKIENETFNTLKNQGYHFEHNFGHGYKNLSTVFAMLMFLAFLIDQAQQICCPLFNKALKKMERKLYFWQKLRTLFTEYFISSWQVLYESIGHGYQSTWLKPDTS